VKSIVGNDDLNRKLADHVMILDVMGKLRDVNEIRPTYSPELKKTFRNNSSNLKNAIGILKNATI